VQTCGVHRGIVASLFEIVNVASNVAPRSGDALAALQRRPDADRKKIANRPGAANLYPAFTERKIASTLEMGERRSSSKA
jgi:hypothetical protein